VMHAREKSDAGTRLLARLCVRCVLCWFAFPLASALGSTGSAADRSALFVGFPATMAGKRKRASPSHSRVREFRSYGSGRGRSAMSVPTANWPIFGSKKGAEPVGPRPLQHCGGGKAAFGAMLSGQHRCVVTIAGYGGPRSANWATAHNATESTPKRPLVAVIINNNVSSSTRK
jgi:hypothetical protein